MTWQTARGYCWARALRMLGDRPARTAAAVALAAVALALPALVFMLAQAWLPFAGRLPVAEVTAYMASSTPASELKALAGRFEAFEGVARVRVVTREQAWAELQRRAGEGQTFGEIKPNPLPDTVVVEFAPRAPTLVIETAAASMRKQPRVDSVQVELDWYRRMMALWQATLGLLAPLAATTALLVVLVVVGVVRALVTVDRGELRVLAHIGADADFVRRPFVYAGALTLGLASACCLGLVALARLFANPLLAEVGRAFGVEVGLAYPPWPLVLAFVAGCLLLGAAAGGLGRPELRPE